MRIGNYSWRWVLLFMLFFGAGFSRVCAQTPAPAETLQRIREIHELQQALVQSADITVRYVIVIHKKTSGDLQERLRKYTASAPRRHGEQVSPELTEILTESGLQEGKNFQWWTLRIRFDGPATDNEFRNDRGELLRRTVFDGKKSASYNAASGQADLQDGPGRVLLIRMGNLGLWLPGEYMSEKGYPLWSVGACEHYGANCLMFAEGSGPPEYILDSDGNVREFQQYVNNELYRSFFYGKPHTYPGDVILAGTAVEFESHSDGTSSLVMSEVMDATFNVEIPKSVFEVAVPAATVLVYRDGQGKPQRTAMPDRPVANVLAAPQVNRPPVEGSTLWLLLLSGLLFVSAGLFFLFTRRSRRQC